MGFYASVIPKSPKVAKTMAHLLGRAIILRTFGVQVVRAQDAGSTFPEA